MLAECVTDLFNKVNAIPSLAATVGLTIGGKAPDPGMTKVPLPAAWVISKAAASTLDKGAPVVSRNLPCLLNFAVLLYIPYTSQADLVTNQLPLLESVIKSVHGTDSPAYERWAFNGYQLEALNSDRLIYRIEFFVDVGTF